MAVMEMKSVELYEALTIATASIYHAKCGTPIELVGHEFQRLEKLREFVWNDLIYEESWRWK